MIIACLAWGSLVWDPRSLPICREWFKDGPFGQVEFLRQSSDGRITLVITPNAMPLRLLWAQMTVADVESARAALSDREGISAKDSTRLIGSWRRGDGSPEEIPHVKGWADALGVEAVVWTALRPRFEGKDDPPSVDRVVAYLRALSGTQRDNAKRYIELAPPQIDTEYRRRIESELGWSPRNY